MYLFPFFSFPTLPYPTLPYPILPYPILPYPILPYPTLSSAHHFRPWPALCLTLQSHLPDKNIEIIKLNRFHVTAFFSHCAIANEGELKAALRQMIADFHSLGKHLFCFQFKCE